VSRQCGKNHQYYTEHHEIKEEAQQTLSMAVGEAVYHIQPPHVTHQFKMHMQLTNPKALLFLLSQLHMFAIDAYSPPIVAGWLCR